MISLKNYKVFIPVYQPQDGNSLVLKGADVLRNNWFFLFVDAMKEMKVPVYGFEALKIFVSILQALTRIFM